MEIARHKELGKPLNYDYDQIKELLDPFYHTYVCKVGTL
jgi:hypothetical protein